MKTVLIPALLLLLWFSICVPSLWSPDLRLSLASWMTTPSSFAVCWTCTRPRCRRSGWGGPRSCNSGRTSCSGMTRAAATSAATPVTTPCCCNSKRVRDGHISVWIVTTTLDLETKIYPQLILATQIWKLASTFFSSLSLLEQHWFSTLSACMTSWCPMSQVCQANSWSNACLPQLGHYFCFSCEVSFIIFRQNSAFC